MRFSIHAEQWMYRKLMKHNQQIFKKLLISEFTFNCAIIRANLVTRTNFNAENSLSFGFYDPVIKCVRVSKGIVDMMSIINLVFKQFYAVNLES